MHFVTITSKAKDVQADCSGHANFYCFFEKTSKGMKEYNASTFKNRVTLEKIG